jgi:hypothetical protein
MVYYGKFCRLIVAIIVMALLAAPVYGLDIRFNNPFLGDNNMFHRRADNEAPMVAESAHSGVLAGGEAGSAANYLRASRAIEVVFLDTREPALAGPEITAKNQSGKEFSTFSDFRKRLEADRQREIEAEAAEKDPSSRLLEYKDTSNKRAFVGETSLDSVSIETEREDLDSTGLLLQAERPSNGEVDAGASLGRPLFQRPEIRSKELPNILLFFQSEPFDFSNKGDYNIVVPYDRFNFFTQPTQTLPRSSARYRLMP